MRFPFVSDGAIPATNCLSNDALFKVQSDVIRRLAEEKSCVFVGRCADYILRDNPRCVNVFISCSNEERIKRICRMYSITEREAEEMMNKADKNAPNTITTTAIKNGELRDISFVYRFLCIGY